MSVKEVDLYGEPALINERLKMILSKFSKKNSDVFQILQGQVRSTPELLDLLESSINLLKDELSTSARALKRTQQKLDEVSQFPLL